MKLSTTNRPIRARYYSIVTCTCCFASILAAQKFLLPTISPYACALPFLLALFRASEKSGIRNTLILISIFTSVDLGNEIYPSTPAILRYAIYVSSLAIFAIHFRTTLKKICLLFPPILLIWVITATNINSIDTNTLIRDILLTYLITVALFTSNSKCKKHSLDLNLINASIIAFALSELYNIVYFRENFLTDYLSYSSTKALVAIPVIHFFHNRSKISVLLAASASASAIVVLLFYQSRMILLATIFIVFASLLSRAIRLKTKSTAILISATVIVLCSIPSLTNSTQFRFVSTIASLSYRESPIEYFEDLDPTRYAEAQLFFDRSAFEILFGSGFGSGIHDRYGRLDFLAGAGSAFTDTEYRTKVYYNFHDVWTDFGLRFGAIPIMFALLTVLGVLCFSKLKPKEISSILLLLLLCSFYSTAGLIIITHVTLALRESLAVHSQHRRHSSLE